MEPLWRLPPEDSPLLPLTVQTTQITVPGPAEDVAGLGADFYLPRDMLLQSSHGATYDSSQQGVQRQKAETLAHLQLRGIQSVGSAPLARVDMMCHGDTTYYVEMPAAQQQQQQQQQHFEVHQANNHNFNLIGRVQPASNQQVGAGQIVGDTLYLTASPESSNQGTQVSQFTDIDAWGLPGWYSAPGVLVQSADSPHTQGFQHANAQPGELLLLQHLEQQQQQQQLPNPVQQQQQVEQLQAQLHQLQEQLQAQQLQSRNEVAGILKMQRSDHAALQQLQRGEAPQLRTFHHKSPQIIQQQLQHQQQLVQQLQQQNQQQLQQHNQHNLQQHNQHNLQQHNLQQLQQHNQQQLQQHNQQQLSLPAQSMQGSSGLQAHQLWLSGSGQLPSAAITHSSAAGSAAADAWEQQHGSSAQVQRLLESIHQNAEAQQQKQQLQLQSRLSRERAAVLQQHGLLASHNLGAPLHQHTSHSTLQPSPHIQPPQATHSLSASHNLSALHNVPPQLHTLSGSHKLLAASHALAASHSPSVTHTLSGSHKQLMNSVLGGGPSALLSASGPLPSQPSQHSPVSAGSGGLGTAGGMSGSVSSSGVPLTSPLASHTTHTNNGLLNNPSGLPQHHQIQGSRRAVMPRLPTPAGAAGSAGGPSQLANPRFMGNAVRAQPPMWAGADWNPRMTAQNIPASGTGVFLPQIPGRGSGSSSARSTPMSTPPTSGATAGANSSGKATTKDTTISSNSTGTTPAPTQACQQAATGGASTAQLESNTMPTVPTNAPGGSSTAGVAEGGTVVAPAVVAGADGQPAVGAAGVLLQKSSE